MKYLGDGMKNLPNNLKYLAMNLSLNNLGRNEENMRHLGDVIKQLPISLEFQN